VAETCDGADLFMFGGEQHRLRGGLQAAVIVTVGQAVTGIGKDRLLTDDVGQLSDLGATEWFQTCA
jgi:hypothetical protein